MPEQVPHRGTGASPVQERHGRGAHATRRRRWLRRVIVALLLLLLAPPLLVAAAFFSAVAFWPYPAGIDAPPLPARRVVDRHGVELMAIASPHGQWHFPVASLEEFGPHLLPALVAVEDARFFEHAGVDWRAVAAAAWENASALRVRRGASTLTMQLHRLRQPAPRSLAAKVEQAVRAAQLERSMGKRDIALEYLNRAPFGGNLVGAGAASWRYFGRPVASLSLAEAALLAGLPQDPNRLRPDRHPERAKRRRDHVLGRMLARGLITAEQHARAVAEPVTARWHPLPQEGPDGLAAAGAMPALLDLARSSAGTKLVATLDAATQRQAASAARAHLDALRPSGASAVAVVVLDTATAEVRAAVSLADGPARALDLTRRPRSTGSALKPFIYAAAFDAGLAAPRTVLRDVPAAWPGYAPDNFDGDFRGPIAAADALAESRNIPALLLLQRVGPERAAAMMASAGLRTLGRRPARYGLTLAVGGAEATPLELAEAYATLARGGAPAPISFVAWAPSPMSPSAARHPRGLWGAPRPPGLLIAATDHGRDARATSDASAPARIGSPGHDTLPFRILSPAACAQVLRALSDEARTAAISPDASRLRAAWKTGTSSGHRDAWCAAVTPRHVVVVWLGNPDGAGAHALIGAEAAAPLALRLLASLHDAETLDPWPDLPLPAMPGPAALARASGAPAATRPAPAPAARLAILSPADGLEIILDPAAPPQRQQVPLRAALAAGAQAADPGSGTLYWFLDGQPLGTADVAAPLWWGPTPGRHTLRVTTSDGRSASSRVTVR